MMGGGQLVVPKYIHPKNNPFNEKEQADIKKKDFFKSKNPEYIKKKEIMEEKKARYKTPFNKGNRQESISTPSPRARPAYKTSIANTQKGQYLGKQFANIQLYEPPPPSKKKKKKEVPSVYGPLESNYTSKNVPFKPAYWHTGPNAPMYNPMELKNLIKEYTINLSGLNPDTNLGVVYETDISKMSKIFTTINNRFTFRNYVRSNLIKEDGNDIKISGTGNTLLSHMKLIDYYPTEYNMKDIHNNALKANGNVIDTDNIILFLACYPQKYDGLYGTKCSKKSAGLNIRIYRLEQSNEDDDEYEEGNEDNKIMALIKEAKNERMNQLDFIKNYLQTKKNSSNTQIETVFKELKVYDKFRTILQDKISPNFVLLYGYYISPYYNFNGLSSLHSIKNSQRFDKDKYETGVLIALTEGPTYCLNYWRQEVFESRGRIRVSKKPGIYDPNVWMSIIFQIYATLIVLNKYINIDGEITKNNFFIKILDNEKYKTIKYWKYIINDISYYIPNYGYLVLFNSNFKEEQMSVKTDPSKDGIKKEKINNCLESIKECINDAQTKDEFIEDIEMIDGEVSASDGLEKLIKESKIMACFLNNRIGTELWQEEIGRDNENIISSQIFRRGEIVIHKGDDGVFRFVLYIGKVDDNYNENNNTNSNLVNIILSVKVEDKIDKKKAVVDMSKLYRYSKNEVRQKDKKKSLSDYSSFIDIFRISSKRSNNGDSRIENPISDEREEEEEQEGGIVINDTSSDINILEGVTSDE
jgi:hypothetical protein